MWTSARPWRLRSIGSRSGRAVSSIQMIRPRYAVSPICAAIIAEDARADAGVAALVAIAEHRVGLVDDHHDRAHRAEHAEDALEVAFGLADVLAAEVLEHDGGHADRSGEAGRQEALAGADRAAEQVAHGHGLELAALDQLRVVEQAPLRRLVPDHRVDAPFRLDELEHALAWRSISRFLSSRK